jgi:hypothetical protein
MMMTDHPTAAQLKRTVCAASFGGGVIPQGREEKSCCKGRTFTIGSAAAYCSVQGLFAVREAEKNSFVQG